MKKVLLKPQREVANSVLAYQYEDDDNWEYFWSMFHNHHECNDTTKACDFLYGAGFCLESVIKGEENGVYYEYRYCMEL